MSRPERYGNPSSHKVKNSHHKTRWKVSVSRLRGVKNAGGVYLASRKKNQNPQKRKVLKECASAPRANSLLTSQEVLKWKRVGEKKPARAVAKEKVIVNVLGSWFVFLCQVGGGRKKWAVSVHFTYPIGVRIWKDKCN